MPEGHHQTRPVQVWVDVDIGIAQMVEYLQTIPGVRTHTSCQGTIGEGGPHPYRAQVMVTWDCQETFDRLAREFDFTVPDGDGWGGPYSWVYIHPRLTIPDDTTGGGDSTPTPAPADDPSAHPCAQRR